jgi:hypothetical protein
MTALTMKTPPTAFILSEASGQRSRENFLVPKGKILRAGEVAKVEDAVSLTTTGDTHTNTTLDGLAATAGLVVGDVYLVSTLSGKAAGVDTYFTYTGAGAGTLSAATTTTLNDTALVLTRPIGVGPWLVAGDTPAGISLYDVDAIAEAKWASFIARDAEVNLKMLIFPNPDDLSAMGDVITDLAGIGIICRD